MGRYTRLCSNLRCGAVTLLLDKIYRYRSPRKFRRALICVSLASTHRVSCDRRRLYIYIERTFRSVRSGATRRKVIRRHWIPSTRTRLLCGANDSLEVTHTPFLILAPRLSVERFIARRQRYSRLGTTPRRRATEDTVSPGRKLSSMVRSFCSVVQCRRRAVPVISSMRR